MRAELELMKEPVGKILVEDRVLKRAYCKEPPWDK